MSKIFAAAFILLGTAGAALAEGPRVEAFGGISYLRSNVDDEGVDGFGWNAAIQGNVNDWLGLEANFSSHKRSLFVSFFDLDNDIDLSLFLFGPRFTLRKAGRMEPFAHALFGAARLNASLDLPGAFTVSETAAAAALGGGLDVRGNRLFAIRVVQVDYVHTRFGGDGQNHARISTGIVFRFGSVD